MRGIRIVLLDYDMTLMNNVFDFYDAINTTIRKYGGTPISYDEFYNLLITHRLYDVIPEGVDQEEFWKYFRRIYRSMYSQPTWGAERFLWYTHIIGLSKVIVSGRECHEKLIWMELERHGLDEYIDDVYTLYHLEVIGGMEEELFDKSWLIKYVLDKYGYEPSEAVYLGDYQQDYKSSNKIGVEFIGVAFDENRAECLRRIGARHVVRNLEEALWVLIDIMREKRNTG